MSCLVPFCAGGNVSPLTRPDADTRAHLQAGGACKDPEHPGRRLSRCNHIDGRCAMHHRDDRGIAQRLMNEAAGIGSFERRMEDGTQVVTKVLNGACQ